MTVELHASGFETAWVHLPTLPRVGDWIRPEVFDHRRTPTGRLKRGARSQRVKWVTFYPDHVLIWLEIPDEAAA